MKHLITLKDWTKEDIKEVLEKAIEIKKNPEKYSKILDNKTLIMFFEKTSTRTRLSFEAGMTQLGGHAVFLDKRTTQVSLSDFDDEIKAVMRFGDVLMYRAVKSENVKKAASFDMVPVIDACSEKYHPCQALGDLLTMIEHSNGLENIKKIAWLGISNNVSNTLKLACTKLGIQVNLLTPKAHEISVDKELDKMCEDTGLVKNTLDLKEGLQDVDYVHTDTWLDMEFFENGEVKKELEQEYKKRIDMFKPFQLNADLVEKYCPEAKIMHCMPCHVGYEITKDAINHANSVIFDQAENRMHAQKAIILKLLGK